MHHSLTLAGAFGWGAGETPEPIGTTRGTSVQATCIRQGRRAPCGEPARTVLPHLPPAYRAPGRRQGSHGVSSCPHDSAHPARRPEARPGAAPRGAGSLHATPGDVSGCPTGGSVTGSALLGGACRPREGSRDGAGAVRRSLGRSQEHCGGGTQAGVMSVLCHWQLGRCPQGPRAGQGTAPFPAPRGRGTSRRSGGPRFHAERRGSRAGGGDTDQLICSR